MNAILVIPRPRYLLTFLCLTLLYSSVKICRALSIHRHKHTNRFWPGFGSGATIASLGGRIRPVGVAAAGERMRMDHAPQQGAKMGMTSLRTHGKNRLKTRKSPDAGLVPLRAGKNACL